MSEELVEGSPSRSMAGSARSPLAGRLAGLTAARLVLLVGLFLATALFYLRGPFAFNSHSTRIVLVTLATAFGLAAAYAWLLRRGKNLERLGLLQLAFDQLVWTVFVYVSGGPTSGAVSFYALSALLGAAVLGARGARTIGLVGIGAYLFLCASFVLKWVVPPPDQPNSGYVITVRELAFPVSVNVVGVIVVAALAELLATRLQRAGGELARAEERVVAAESLALLGRVAAGLAHEIRNPLGSISGSVEMLREAPGLAAEDRELCDIVQREVKRLENLVSDMMDVARPRAPNVDVISLVRIAQDVVSLAENESNDVRVGYEGPAEGAFALCDGALIRQVVWNLVRNGVQVSPPQSTVLVTVIERSDTVELNVKDAGPGVSPKQRELIFDAFYTTRTQGAGLGLAVVKRIMDDHAAYGARLDVDTAAGAGVFRLYFKRSSNT